MAQTMHRLARRHPRLAPLLNLELLAALLLYAVGITAPLFTFEKLFVFSNTVSVLSALAELWREGQWFVFALLAVFTLLVPVAKLALLARVWNGVLHGRHARALDWLAHYGKWSMLDVFVVAVLLVTVKLGALGHVELHYGLYAYAASVLLGMLATAQVAGRARRALAPA